MSKPLILLGGGGHAKVLLDAAKRLQYPLLGLVDPYLPEQSIHLGLTVLGDDLALVNFSTHDVELINGLGAIPYDQGLRQQLYKRFKALGYNFKTIVDPTVFLALEHELGEGVQVLARAIIQSGTVIAENTIINSGAIVEHDCRIGRHVHIAPGAVLSGGVKVGDDVHIGTGAIIIQGITIGAGCIIGAGSVVTKNVPAQHIVYPARSCTQALQR